MKKYNFKSIIAALVCACSLAFQAKAQTTVNITSVGTITLTSITNTAGTTTYGNGTTPYISSNGGTVSFNFTGTINTALLTSTSETISIPITVAGASGTSTNAHFPGLGLGMATTIANPSNPSQVFFNVTYSSSNSIILTPTQAALDYAGSVPFTISGQAGLTTNGNTTTQNNATTTVYTVGGSSYTLENTPYAMVTGRNCVTQTSKSAYTTPVGSAVGYFGYQIYCVYNQMLNGQLDPTSSELTSDVITATTLTPQNSAQILSVSWYKTTSNDEIDQIVPGQDSMSTTNITSTTSAYQIYTPPAGATAAQIEAALQPGQHAIVDNGDGTYTVYINWGPLIGSHDQYSSTTPDVTSTDNGASQAVVAQAEQNKLSAIDVRQYVTITYIDPSVPDTVLATTTSNSSLLGNSSAKIGANNSTSAQTGQSLIKVYYVDLSGNSIQQVVPNVNWAANVTSFSTTATNTPAVLAAQPSSTTIAYNGTSYTLVTDAATAAAATGIPASTATGTVMVLTSSEVDSIPYPNVGDTVYVYYVYELTNPLPITGLQLTAQPKGNTVQLTWGTLTEINSKNFTVQRSADGGNTWVRSIRSLPKPSTATAAFRSHTPHRTSYCKAGVTNIV